MTPLKWPKKNLEINLRPPTLILKIGSLRGSLMILSENKIISFMKQTGIPPTADLIKEVGLKYLQVYIRRIHNTLAQFFNDLPIMNLFLELERRPGYRFKKQWWYQEILKLVEAHGGEQTNTETERSEDLEETEDQGGQGGGRRQKKWKRG